MIYILNSQGQVSAYYSYAALQQSGTYTLYSKEINQALNICSAWLQGQPTFALNTSGTTGTPKPISLSRVQIEASAKITGEFFNYKKGQKSVLCLSSNYIGGFMVLIRALVYQMDLYLLEPAANPLYILPNHFDYISIGSYQLHYILQSEETVLKLQNYSSVLIGGSAISARLAELLKPFKNEIYHTYGMTETCSMVAIKLLSQDSSENHYTFFDTIAWHLNEDSCIKIKGAITNNEWIETHDRATVVSEESVYIHGRSDFVINSGGIKIYPEQLEAEIDSLMQKFMFRYMFSYMPDAVLGQRLVMVLEADTLKHELAYEIYNKLSSQLDKMKLPKEIYCMPQFIYTDQGKFRRNEIQALLHEAKCIQLVTPIIHK